MIRLKKHILTNEQADLLIERYYEGLTTGQEENQLRAFLSRTDLPEIYRAEQAMFGYEVLSGVGLGSCGYDSFVCWPQFLYSISVGW